MSTHPNAILMVALKPDDLSNKTMRDILSVNEVKCETSIKIGDHEYDSIVMEDDYNQSFQVSADVGDLVFLDMVTYGYGKTISWGELEKRKNELEIWAKNMCAKFNCSYTIYVTANYW